VSNQSKDEPIRKETLRTPHISDVGRSSKILAIEKAAMGESQFRALPARDFLNEPDVRIKG
jgi:hypothetical protein